MSLRLLFWIPAVLRLLLVFTAGAVVAYFFGLAYGLTAALAGVLVLAVSQLFYLYRLAHWLDHPDSSRLPDGWGVWSDIFARLYKLRRGDEKNRAELNEWLTRFRQAMNLLPDGVAIMDDVLFLEWCNPAAEKHLGLDNEQDKGRRVTNLVRAPQFIDYIVLGRYDHPITLTVRDRKLIVQIIPFENRRQILVSHDITDSERIDTMRRDFIANASHELRTPLTVINGFLEIAQSQPDLDREIRMSHLKMMHDQGQRMQNLVEDMLTLTRLESADYPLRTEAVDMRGLLETLLEEARALSSGRHDIALEFDGPDIMGSRDELHSAFGNLVFNAIRYTPEGGSVKLAWRSEADHACFSVNDSGIGIAPEHLSRLTERFYRVDKSRSRETQGTGLGLAIVRHVLLRHHAVLDIRSEVGKGSTFIVRFPLKSLSQ